MRTFAQQLWNATAPSEGYDLVQKICEALKRCYSFVFEGDVEGVGNFEFLLLYSCVVLFFGLIIAIVAAIFEKDEAQITDEEN